MKWCAAIVVSVLACLTGSPAAAVAPASQPVSAVSAENDGEQFLTSQGGDVRFDVAGAMRAGASWEVVQAGLFFNELQESGFRDDGRRNGFPVWGNWCGPGHGGGEPIDVLDSLCKTHDLCYEQLGYFNCDCDEELIAGIRQRRSEMRWRERAMARAIEWYFVIAPCKRQPLEQQSSSDDARLR